MLAIYTVPGNYPSIQAAVNAADASPDPSNEVLVSPGVYHETKITITSALELLSTGGAANTTIDGGQATTNQDGIIQVIGNTGSVTIGGPASSTYANGQGFTLQNATTNSDTGDINLITVQGIAASVTIQNNSFVGLNGVNSPFDTGILGENTPNGSPIIVQNNTFQKMWQGVLFQQTVGSGSISNNIFQGLVPSTDSGTGQVFEPEGVFALTLGGSTYNVSGLMINGNNFSNFNGLAITVAGGYPGFAPAQFSNVTIDNNNISSIGFTPDTYRAGILLINYADTASDESSGGVFNSTIANNTLVAQTSCASGSVGIGLLGENNNLTIDNNLVENLNFGVFLLEQVPGAGYSSGLGVHFNSFTGNTYAIYNPSPNLLDASNNYYGAIDSATVKAQASGGNEVDYNPYLGNGTNTTTATTGFVPASQVPYTDAVQITGNDSVQAGSPYTLTINVNPDPNIGNITEALINWGDGTTTNDTTTYTPTHTYTPTTQTTYTISATVQNGSAQTFQVANTQTVTVTVVSTLVVTMFTPTVSGFHVRFNQPINTSVLRLYAASQNQPAGVTFSGPNGPVAGSLKLDGDGQGFTFVATGPPLAEQGAGTYTVTLLGTSNGVLEANSPYAPLDGTGSGTPGSNYVTTFNVAASAGPFVTIPDFARGPGQTISVKDSASTSTDTGLPIEVSDGTSVNSVMLVLTYDPTLLTITSVNPAADLPAGTQIVTNNSVSGRLAICVTAPAGTQLSSGLQSLVELNASVPMNAPYGSKAVLNVQVLDVGYVNGTTTAGAGDQAVQVVDYLGDTLGLGTYYSQDATNIRKYLVSSVPNAGFAAFPLVDPTIIADIANLGYIVSQDATYIAQYLVGKTTPIPAYTGPPSSVASGPDPEVFLPRNLSATQGNALDVPVELLQTNDAPIELQSFNLVISYDPSTFSVADIQLGNLATGFQLSDRVDATQGLIFISGSSNQPLTLTPGMLGDLVRLDFTILATAKSGSFVLNLLGNSGTSITSLNDGGLTLVPAPTNAADDPVDGVVTVGDPWFTSPFRPGRPPIVFNKSSEARSSRGEAIETIAAGPSFATKNQVVETLASSVSPSPAPISLTPSGTPLKPSGHDLAIESFLGNNDADAGSPVYLVPLATGGGSDDSSDANTPASNHTKVASSTVRVAFRHRALARIIAMTDPSQ